MFHFRMKAGAALLLLPLLAPLVRAQDLAIGTYTSPARSFSTATYWVVGPQTVVLIDTQFLPHEGLLAKQEAERVAGKPVKHALVLHPNPDKFNGTAALQGLGVQVLTSDAVIAAIPAVHTIRWGWFADEYMPHYPSEAAKPSSFGNVSREVTWGGVPLKLHVMGPGCSAVHVVVQAGDVAFVGDLVNPENHAWLELGLIEAWLQRLEDVRALGVRRIFPGRGKPGGLELLDQQAAYLRFVRQTVLAEKPKGDLGWFTKLKLQRTIEARYPLLGFPIFVRDGLAAVWRVEAVKGTDRARP